ncbi:MULTISPECIES: hypothetical protein [unclassified Microcoleus]|uniref:hypothetical protein n=1 Tax=unclassified Microcoleus TaxID=2642155 RepID=UPI002FD42D91
MKSVDSCYIMFGGLTVIPVGAGSPAIVAKNRQSQKPAPTMYDARSIGHDISCSLTRKQLVVVRKAVATNNQ